MAGLKYLVYRAAFEALWATQLARLVRAFSRSRGVVFTMHRVLPDAPADFSPNSILQITPQFLDFVIFRLRELKIEIVSMDEAIKRIEAPQSGGQFAVLSFDDAYKDNLVHALPILRRHKCPFTLYVPSGFVDGVGQVWWQALEDIIAQQEALSETDIRGEIHYHNTKTLAQKNQVYAQLYQRMRTIAEAERVAFMDDLGKRYGVEMETHCRELIMDWGELEIFAREPLCTIGAHSVHHYELAKLDVAQAREEMAQCISVIKAQFGAAPRHFSYPIGGKASAGSREYDLARDMGLASGVTTRPGGLYYSHRESLFALPRISLNGYFQNQRYVEILATGALFSMLGA